MLELSTKRSWIRVSERTLSERRDGAAGFPCGPMLVKLMCTSPVNGRPAVLVMLAVGSFNSSVYTPAAAVTDWRLLRK